MEKDPETVRIDTKIRSSLFHLGRELGKDPALFVNECAAAIMELIKEPTPAIPHIVTHARIMREQNATYLDPKRPFPSPSSPSKRVIRESTRSSASSTTESGGAQQKSNTKAEARRSGDKP